MALQSTQNREVFAVSAEFGNAIGGAGFSAWGNRAFAADKDGGSRVLSSSPRSS